MIREAVDAAVEATKSEKKPPRSRSMRRGMWFPNWFSRSDYTLENSELIFSATSRRANAIMAMPVQLYQKTKPRNTPLNDMLGKAPNPNMTSAQFFRAMESCCCTTGNGYALKVYDTNWNLERIDLLNPDYVAPLIDETTGELWYEIRPPASEMFWVHNYYMIHIPFLTTNGYAGLNPVKVLFDSLSYNDDIKKFSADQLKKGMNAAVILEAPSNLGEDQQTAMIESFQRAYKNTGGNALLLESGVTAKALNLSPVDSKLFEVEKITRSRVAMVYNIPPHLLGDYSDTSFSTMEQQMLEFLTFTMLPIVTAYEQELDRKLLTDRQRQLGYRFKFNMNNIIRADAKTMAEVNFKAVRSAQKTPNEIRAEEGRPAIDGGDELLISKDMVPFSYLLKNPTLATETKGGEQDGNEQSREDEDDQQEES